MWRQHLPLAPATYSIYSRRFDASTQALSAPTELAGTSQGAPFMLSAAAAGANVALAWTVPGAATSEIRATVAAPGSATPGVVTSLSSRYQVSDLHVESFGAVGFSVIWQELQGYSRGTNAYVNLQRHDAAGAATGAPVELLARGTSWVSGVTGAGVTAGTVLAVDAGSDGHVVGEVQIAGQSEPGVHLFGR